jgi:hypothetical protein
MPKNRKAKAKEDEDESEGKEKEENECRKKRKSKRVGGTNQYWKKTKQNRKRNAEDEGYKSGRGKRMRKLNAKILMRCLFSQRQR